MARITAAESELRKNQVVDLLLKGAKRSQIIDYANKRNWGVKPRMIDKYIEKATAIIRESSVVDREYEIALAKQRLEWLYMQNVATQDLREARAVVKTKSELLGLEAPKGVNLNTDDLEIKVTIKNDD